MKDDNIPLGSIRLDSVRLHAFERKTVNGWVPLLETYKPDLEEVMGMLFRRMGVEPKHAAVLAEQLVRPSETPLPDYGEDAKAPKDWKPTHRHADGGDYRLLSRNTGVRIYCNRWQYGMVAYENEHGHVFVTDPERFDQRFAVLTGGAE